MGDERLGVVVPKPCLAEHPVVTELAKTVPVVGLNYKDARDNALPWLRKNGDPYALSVHDPPAASPSITVSTGCRKHTSSTSAA